MLFLAVSQMVVVQNLPKCVPGQMLCPYCHTNVVTKIEYKIGPYTWLVCGLLGVFLWVKTPLYSHIHMKKFEHTAKCHMRLFSQQHLSKYHSFLVFVCDLFHQVIIIPDGLMKVGQKICSLSNISTKFDQNIDLVCLTEWR